MATWLLKTEPGEFSFADLRAKGSCTWDGVSNAQAVNFLRDFAKGDAALIYHTGDEKAIVGEAKVTRGAYADPKDKTLDAQGRPKLVVVDLAPAKAARTPLTLAAMKADARFASFLLLRQGRLSVMPVPPEIEKLIRSATGL